jgi:hypothetical protein
MKERNCKEKSMLTKASRTRMTAFFSFYSFIYLLVGAQNNITDIEWMALNQFINATGGSCIFAEVIAVVQSALRRFAMAFARTTLVQQRWLARAEETCNSCKSARLLAAAGRD